MTDRGGDSTGSLVTVARAVKTRGLKGEIVADLLTDFPDRFGDIEQLIALSLSGERKVLKIEHYSFYKDRVVLKFAHYDDVETAGDLIGCDFAVPESERVALPEGHYYDWELEGCVVSIAGGAGIGRVRAVLRTGGVEVLVVAGEGGREYLVPLAAAIVTAIDTAHKSIVIDPPEGLLDL